jgi:hypothetical protein
MKLPGTTPRKIGSKRLVWLRKTTSRMSAHGFGGVGPMKAKS